MDYPFEVSPPDPEELARAHRRRLSCLTASKVFAALARHKAESLIDLRDRKSDCEIRAWAEKVHLLSEPLIEYAWWIIGTWQAEPEFAERLMGRTPGTAIPEFNRYEPDFRIADFRLPVRDNVGDVIAQVRAADRERKKILRKAVSTRVPRDLETAVDWFVRHRVCSEKQEAIAAAAGKQKSFVSTTIRQIAQILELPA